MIDGLGFNTRNKTMANDAYFYGKIEFESNEDAVLFTLKYGTEGTNILDYFTNFFNYNGTRQWADEYFGGKWMTIDKWEQNGSVIELATDTAWTTKGEFFNNLKDMVEKELNIFIDITGVIIEDGMGQYDDYNNGAVSRWCEDRIEKYTMELYNEDVEWDEDGEVIEE